jgi:hypothetical protein
MKNTSPFIPRITDPEPLARRKFLGLSIAVGTGAGLLSATDLMAAPSSGYVDESCESPSAGTLLAMFSGLAFRLPNKLNAAVAAQETERKLYGSFETRYDQLVGLVKKLKVDCGSSSRNDPKFVDMFELAEEGLKNAKYLKAVTVEDKNVAYLQISTLVAAGRQIGRSASDVEIEHSPDKNTETICKMLSLVKEMEEVKAQLDAARKNFSDIFGEFVNTVGLINKTMLEASEAAAEAERGTANGRALALAKIAETKRLITSLEDQSISQQDGAITTQELKLLLGVPEGMLDSRIPAVTSFNRHDRNSSPFRNASYDPEAARADSAYAAISRIVVTHMLPGDRWTVRLLSIAVFGILKLYGENPPRTRLVRNALQSVPWTSSNSNISAATTELVKISV